jgi:hypothetical protein
MVATTFAADTPLAVAGFVARNGIAGNWIWWNAAAGSVLIYAMLFGIGETLPGSYRVAMLCFAIGAAAVAIIWVDLSLRG